MWIIFPKDALWEQRKSSSRWRIWSQIDAYLKLGKLFIFILFIFNFYCCIVASQHCVAFCCTAKWVSYTHTYIYPLPFGLPSHLGHRRGLIEFAALYGRFSLVIYFVNSINSVYVWIPISQFLSSSLFPLGILKFVFYICDSISALQIHSPIPFF